MYIKLGSINLQYYQETNDWMIMGEVLDSGMSYEKPILVRTSDELDIWFGKDYKDYSYMQELVNMGVVLYLYKPISDKTTGGNNYIDLDTYTEDDTVWLRNVETDWVEKVVSSPEDYKFKYNTGDEIEEVGFKVDAGGNLIIISEVDGREFCTLEIVREKLPEQISKIYKNQIKFHVINSESLWIYYEGSILNIDLLPQNINLTSISANNRDTIIVSSPEDPIDFTYLDYNSEEDEFGIFNDEELVNQFGNLDPTYLREINSESIAEGYQTLVYKIIGDRLTNGDYFVFPNTAHGTDTSSWMLYYCGNTLPPEEVMGCFPSDRVKKVTGFTQLLTQLRGLGYTLITYKDELYAYSKTIIPVTNFYKSAEIKVTPGIKLTEYILSRYITPGIEAVSKTIGRSSEFEDDLIKLSLEKVGENYRATISRYTYSEVFEGSLKYTPGEQRLDNLISQDSKLIRCKFEGNELRTGTYYLRGAQKEETNHEMYKYALKIMLSTEYNEPVYPDYFLIPDKYYYTTNIISDNPYETFLNYATEVGCQFLIENKASTDLYRIVEVDTIPSQTEKGVYYKVGGLYYDWEEHLVTDPYFIAIVEEGGDFVFNLTTDKENRLIYFFKDMTYYYDKRPGYYVYLRGVLLNEFSVSVGDILYWNPTQDAFLVDDIETRLERYKSNYLVCDNQTYFYKNYQDGDSYITTGWTRFIAGKVFRELQKNSGDILGQQMLGVIRSKISDLIYSIESGFSIVETIGITGFEPTDNGQSLKVSLATVMNDLVKNNVNLDITVNYNNNIYGTIS